MAHGIADRGRARIYATVLYWQSRELPLLERAVTSLLSQEGATFDLRITLIDNGSGLEPPRFHDPRVDFSRLGENLGFAAGHNLGMRRALARGADFVLLFNSDAIAEPGCLAELLNVATAAPRAAFVGPLLLLARAPDRLESAGHAFNRWARHREMHRGRRVTDLELTPKAVDAVSGCALLARCSAVEAIGFLDESLFAYFEDMDWCLRAREQGYAVLLAPRARVLHTGGGSTGNASTLSTYYSVRNHMVVAARFGGPVRGQLLMLMVLGYHLAFVARSPQSQTSDHLRALVRGAWAACTGRMGRCGSNAAGN